MSSVSLEKVRFTNSTNSSSTQTLLVFFEDRKDDDIDFIITDSNSMTIFENIKLPLDVLEIFSLSMKLAELNSVIVYSKKPEHKYLVFLFFQLYNFYNIYTEHYEIAIYNKSFKNILEENKEKFFEKLISISGKIYETPITENTIKVISDYINHEIFNVSHFHNTLTNKRFLLLEKTPHNLVSSLCFSLPINRRQQTIDFEALEAQCEYFCFNGEKILFSLLGEDYNYLEHIAFKKLPSYVGDNLKISGKLLYRVPERSDEEIEEKFYEVQTTSYVFSKRNENLISLYAPNGHFIVLKKHKEVENDTRQS